MSDSSIPNGTTPPSAWRTHKHHWLRSARREPELVAKWLGDVWVVPGEIGPANPMQMALRGWSWHAPAFPPDPFLAERPTGEDGNVDVCPGVRWRPGEARTEVHGRYTAAELRAVAEYIDRHQSAATRAAARLTLIG